MEPTPAGPSQLCEGNSAESECTGVVLPELHTETGTETPCHLNQPILRDVQVQANRKAFVRSKGKLIKLTAEI